MKITKQELIELDACTNGLTRFVEQTGNTDAEIEVSTLIGGVNTTSDLLWLAGKKLEKTKIVRFACDCALINIALIRPYTDQYESILSFLNNPTADSTAAYVADVTAARAAAYATDAAYTAYAAATYARARAARAATADAADAVNKLLIKLFE